MTDLETKLTADLAAANEKAAAQATAIVNLTAERDTATAANKALTKQIAEFTNKAMEAEVTAVVDAAIADGRLLPKDKDKAVKTGLALRNAAGVEFKAGDGSPFDGWKDLLASGGKVVDLSEKGAATGADAKGVDAEYELGRKAALKIEGRSDAD